MGSFEATAEMMITGPGARPVMQLLTLATQIARCSAAALVVRRKDSYQILQAVGYFGSNYGGSLPIAGNTKNFAYDYLEIRDEGQLKDISAVTGFGPWRWAAIAQLPNADLSHQVGIVCLDRRKSSRDPNCAAMLRSIAAIAAEEWRTIAYISESESNDTIASESTANGKAALTDDIFHRADVDSRVAEKNQSRSGDSVVEEDASDRRRQNDPRSDIVTDFLLRTLLSRHKLSSRSGIAYHSIRGWRSSIRDVQISALRSLKTSPPDTLVQQISSEIEATAESLYGSSAFQAIVPVPCGHSGAGCLIEKVAECLAERMNIQIINAFDPLAVRGSSHPKTNSRRPRMKLRSVPDVPLLLIDDVATSGSHIAEATSKLREFAPAVFPLAWIGGR